jgi:alpha-beta hydrolase superfamily lysophospholipase
MPGDLSGLVRHATADVAPGVALHYVDTESGDTPMVLLHGFPETSHEWTRLIGRFADASYRVIAPDYRRCSTACAAIRVDGTRRFTRRATSPSSSSTGENARTCDT